MQPVHCSETKGFRPNFIYDFYICIRRVIKLYKLLVPHKFILKGDRNNTDGKTSMCSHGSDSVPIDPLIIQPQIGYQNVPNFILFQFYLVKVDLRYPPCDWLALSLAEFKMAESAENIFKTREILKKFLYNWAADRDSWIHLTSC